MAGTKRNRDALASRREQVWAAGRDRLRSLLPKALDVLEAQLEADPEGGRPANWHAALALLRLGGLAGADLSDPGGPTDAGEILEGQAFARRGPTTREILARYDDEEGAITDDERRDAIDELRELGAFGDS